MSRADEIRVMTFGVGGTTYAFEILQVQRVLPYTAPTPGGPEFAEGTLVFERQSVPVVDLRKRMGVAAPVSPELRLMVVGADQSRVALIVDDVREVLKVESTTIVEAQATGAAAAAAVGAIERAGQRILLLNAHRLLSAAERLALAPVGGTA